MGKRREAATQGREANRSSQTIARRQRGRLSRTFAAIIAASALALFGLTSLSEIALQPRTPASALVSVDPASATQLCGRSLDWIEIVEA